MASQIAANSGNPGLRCAVHCPSDRDLTVHGTEQEHSPKRRRVNLSLTRISASKCKRGMCSESRRRGSQIATPSTVLIVALVASLSVICPILSTAQSQVTEYQLKAAFLFRFAQFVEWPAEALGKAGDSFLICVVGEGPFHGDLEQTIQGKVIAARTVRVRHVKQVQEAQGCRVLFIGKDEF